MFYVLHLSPKASRADPEEKDVHLFFFSCLNIQHLHYVWHFNLGKVQSGYFSWCQSVLSWFSFMKVILVFVKVTCPIQLLSLILANVNLEIRGNESLFHCCTLYRGGIYIYFILRIWIFSLLLNYFLEEYNIISTSEFDIVALSIKVPECRCLLTCYQRGRFVCVGF